jgi:hypothetical protein
MGLAGDEFDQAYKLAEQVDLHLTNHPSSRYQGKEDELFSLLMQGKRRFNAKGDLVMASPEKMKAGNRLWTQIDELDGQFNGRWATYYDVHVKGRGPRDRAGVAMMGDKNILEFHLNISENIQRQGVGTEIFKRAIGDYYPSKIKGWWKKSDIYTGGESVNLKILKEKVNQKMRIKDAVFETPTGKLAKKNGFGGEPEIVKYADDEVIIHFTPTK